MSALRGNLAKLMRRSSAFTLYEVQVSPMFNWKTKEWHPTPLSPEVNPPSPYDSSGWHAAEARRKRIEERNRRNEARQGR